MSTSTNIQANGHSDGHSGGRTRRDVRALLGPYLAIQLALVIAVQVITGVRGPQIDAIDGLLLVPSAVYFGWFQWHNRIALSQIRFAAVVAHAGTFVLVNGSYHLAAIGRVIANRESGDGIGLDGSWFGPLIAMCGFWAIGLTIHIASAVAARGFES